jgi:hypothetical protein
MSTAKDEGMKAGERGNGRRRERENAKHLSLVLPFSPFYALATSFEHP